MNLTITASYFTTRATNHPGQFKVIAEDVQIEQTNNAREILLQLDQKDVIEFMEQQDFTVTKREVAA